jgi:hypothetical protein
MLPALVDRFLIHSAGYLQLLAYFVFVWLCQRVVLVKANCFFSRFPQPLEIDLGDICDYYWLQQLPFTAIDGTISFGRSIAHTANLMPGQLTLCTIAWAIYAHGCPGARLQAGSACGVQME